MSPLLRAKLTVV